MICRAKGCISEAMVGADLCGYHDERNEDGVIFTRKSGPRSGNWDPEVIKRRSETKRRNVEARNARYALIVAKAKDVLENAR